MKRPVAIKSKHIKGLTATNNTFEDITPIETETLTDSRFDHNIVKTNKSKRHWYFNPYLIATFGVILATTLAYLFLG